MAEQSLMERLEEIKKKMFEISSISDYLNCLSATMEIAKEMTKGTYTQEELDLFNKISSVLEHSPEEFCEEGE